MPENKYERQRTVAKCVTLQQLCSSTSQLDNKPMLKDFPDTFTFGYDGQIFIQAQTMDDHGENTIRWQDRMTSDILTFLKLFGDFKMAMKIDSPSTGMRMWHVEFYEHVKADDIVELLKHRRGGFLFKVSLWPALLQGSLLMSSLNQDFKIWITHYFDWEANPVPGAGNVHEEELHDQRMAFRRRWNPNPFFAQVQAAVQAAQHVDRPGYSGDASASFHPNQTLDFDETFCDRHPDHDGCDHQEDLRIHRATQENCRRFVEEPFFDDSFNADGRNARGRSTRNLFQRENKNVVNLDKILRGVDCRSTVRYIYIYNGFETDCCRSSRLCFAISRTESMR